LTSFGVGKSNKMDQIFPGLSIRMDDKLYIKDPVSSDLGKKILRKSIELIDTVGMERFTFKKVAMELGTTESSIYRYFENKHKILLYLTAWYWFWLETYIAFSVSNIEDPLQRLRIMINILCRSNWGDQEIDSINLASLHRIVIAESSKAFLTKEVDQENKEGLFMGFKQLCGRFSKVFLLINPSYNYANMLSTTLVEGVYQQKFFAAHFPGLSDVSDNTNVIGDFFYETAVAVLKKNN
jgi:hypothetical protein